MVNFNKVFLIGNLTRDPELRYTPAGSPVTTLRIAVNTPFKDKSGQLQKDTCFINVVVWGQMAEVCNQYLQKGRPVFVEGRLQSRVWQNNEGKNRSTIEVRALRVQFMPQRVKEESREIDLGEEPEDISPVDSSDNKIEDDLVDSAGGR
jgi:single-strand DNA-binding protein